jgi:hypothetical protein
MAKQKWKKEVIIGICRVGQREIPGMSWYQSRKGDIG